MVIHCGSKFECDITLDILHLKLGKREVFVGPHLIDTWSGLRLDRFPEEGWFRLVIAKYEVVLSGPRVTPALPA